MPGSLERFHHTGELHFITFSCYRRRAKLTPERRCLFERSLEMIRKKYELQVFAYVLMPEHVHLLVSEPESKELATAMQALKQSVSRRVALRAKEPFWQPRYYDFNVRSQHKFIEKVRYIHRNPVERGLVNRPEDWPWSSFDHYATGVRGTVEIESDWTARWREKMGKPLTVKIRKPTTPP